MKKFALAASMSLLLSTTAAMANEYFDLHPERAKAAQKALNYNPGGWVGYLVSNHKFWGKMTTVSDTTQTWTAALPEDHPASLDARKQAFAAALDAEGVREEGVVVTGLLDRNPADWDTFIQAALGGTEDAKYKAFQAALRVKLAEVATPEEWTRWHASMLAAEHLPASMGKDGETLKHNQRDSLILAALLTGDDDSAYIYNALSSSGYLTLTAAGQALFLDEGGSADAPATATFKRPTVADYIAGRRSLTLGGSKFPTLVQDYVRGADSSLLPVVDTPDQTVLVSTSHDVGADLVVDDIGVKGLSALPDEHFEAITVDTGTTAQLDDESWLQMIATKLAKGGTLKFNGVGDPNPDWTNRLAEIGLFLSRKGGGSFTYIKPDNLPTSFNHEEYLRLNPARLASLMRRSSEEGISPKAALTNHYVFWGRNSNLPHREWTPEGYLEENRAQLTALVKRTEPDQLNEALRSHWENWGQNLRY